MSEGTPEEAPANAQTHDANLTERLTEFMATGWAPGDDPSLLEVDEVAPHATQRRAALSALFPGDVLVVPTGGYKVRSNDTDYPFRAGSDYAWLVGDLEPDGVLVLWPQPGGTHRAVAYIPARADRSKTDFFTDRRYGELWIGPRRGPEEVAHVFGLETVPRDELAEVLGALDPETVRMVRDVDPSVDALVAAVPAPAPDPAGAPPPPSRDAELSRALSELKLCKTDWEVEQLQGAIDATVRGFADVVRELPAATVGPRGERWLEGTFWRRSRLEGNDVGYGSIVACGHHATTLHWTRDDGPVEIGELLLLDMGVESTRLYTADVTRTLPVGGRFSPEQRKVYDVVHRAQLAGIEAVRPGVKFSDVHKAAMTVITEALVGWGLLEGDVEVLVKDTMHRRWSLHGTSHHLGMDVHDCAHARNELYREGELKPGMVITVEPGLYFQHNDTLAPEELRGIGVRIEDDVLVTGTGSRVLSAALPTQADEVEAWMAQLLAS